MRRISYIAGILYFLLQGWQLEAQPLVDIGLFKVNDDTLEVRLLPKGNFNGVVSNVVFTLKWKTACSNQIGNVIQFAPLSDYIPMMKSGPLRNNGDYTYQVFAGTGLVSMAGLGSNWVSNSAVLLLKIPVTGLQGWLEIATDTFTSQINGSYFVSLNGLPRTGMIYQHAYYTVHEAQQIICQGDSFFAAGAYRKTSGIYYDTLQNASGCDSVVTTHLTVLPAFFSSVSVSICSGESYYTGGAWQTDAGLYYDTLTTQFGCDSVIQTALSVIPTVSTVRSVAICPGDSFYAAGAWQTVSGTYYDTFVSAQGCDSVLTTILQVHPAPAVSVTPYTPAICIGSSVTLTANGGSYYTWSTGQTGSSVVVTPAANTFYSVTAVNSHGCTASTGVTVVVHSQPVATIFPSMVSICEGSSTILTAGGGVSYQWNTGHSSQNITVSPAATTTFSVTVTNNYGCSASASRLVEVNPLPAAHVFPPSASICNGSEVTLTATGGVNYQWNSGAIGAVITVSPVVNTTYTVTVIDSRNCSATASSTVEVRASLHASVSPSNPEICQGDQVLLTASGGSQYSWSGGATTASILVSPLTETTYSVTVSDGGVCVDTASVTVRVRPLPPASVTPSSVEICQGDTIQLTANGGTGYAWSNGATTYMIEVAPQLSASYTVTVTDDRGCSVSQSVNLVVYPVKRNTVDTAICAGEVYYAGGGGQTTSGIYYDTLVSFDGCDSVIETRLQVWDVSVTEIYSAICEGDSFFAGGQYRHMAGVYHDTLNSAYGCDSIIMTHLTVNPVAAVSLNVSACKGDSVWAGGQFRTVNGIYYDTLATFAGCDSVVVTHLTFQNPDTFWQDILIYEGDTYFAGGAEQGESGVYYDTLKNQYQCDSIVITNLSVQHIESEVTINLVDSTLTIQSLLDKRYADNTYGPNAVGWRVTRTLDSLIRSDHIRWTLHDAGGQKRLDFRVDYFEYDQNTPSGFRTLGVRGGDGYLYLGDSSDIVKTETSIDYNFNQLGYILYSTSPATDSNYTPNPLYPGWIYDVWYKATVSLNAFGSSGFGYFHVLAVHASPDKNDLNRPIVEDSVIPSPCPRNQFVKVIMCEGEQYFAGGNWQTAPGTYQDTLYTPNGCHIPVVTQITVLPDVVTELFVQICEGESYFAGGASRSVSGTYYDTLTAETGCDSIVVTHLSVLNTIVVTQAVGICEGESYWAGGAARTESGIYTDTFSSYYGCDSIMITHLTVSESVQTFRNIFICAGDSVYLQGAFRKVSGLYRDTLTALNGCDSIILTTLHTESNAVEIQTVQICAGDSFFAAGNWQTQSGIYYDTLQGWRCDSVVITSLEVLETDVTILPVTVCSGESYFAAGAERFVSGIYYDTLASARGCDSILITMLTVLPVYSDTANIALCEGQSYYAAGAWRTSSGIYYDTLSAFTGCDSVIVTELIVYPAYKDTVLVSICDNESYFAGGAWRNQSGLYTDSFITRHGCDSAIFTLLTVLPSPVTTLNFSICSGDSVFTGGMYRTQPGIYYDTLLANNHCDSIVVTTLSVNPVHLHAFEAQICYGDSFYAGGAYQTTPGIYYDTLHNQFGCDSVVQTTLIVEPAIRVSQSVQICYGDSFYAGGAYQTITGSYNDTFSAFAGCDSVVTTLLTVGRNVVINHTVSICEGDSFYAGGGFQMSSGTYYDTLLHNGCDSVIVTQLQVTPPQTNYREIFICAGQAYYAGGDYQNTSGIYYDTLRAVSGCDSIVVTELTVNQNYHTVLNVSICQGEEYYAGGAYRTVSGTYRDTLSALNGCDSIITIHLTVYPKRTTYRPLTICQGETVFAGGQQRGQTGIYLDTFTTEHGCDSIVLTILNVLPVKTKTVYASICDNAYYYAGGSYRNQPGIYHDTLTAENGCDSVITTILTVSPTSLINRQLSICRGDSVFLGGSMRGSAGTYYDTLTNQFGCDSVVITQLAVKNHRASSVQVVLCDGESYYAGGGWQTNSGVYYDTLLAANGCDSVVTTTLTVYQMYQLNNPVAICEGESYYAAGAWQSQSGVYADTFISSNGCDSIVITYLDVLSATAFSRAVTICSDETFFAGGAWRNTSGVYYDTLLNAYGCDSILRTALTVLPVYHDTQRITICSGDSFYAAGAWQRAGGFYPDTFITADGCDSIVTTALTVADSYSVMFPVTVCEGDSFFAGGGWQTISGYYYDTLHSVYGCDSILITELMFMPRHLNVREMWICNGDSFYAGGNWQTASGIYYDTLMDINGCDSIIITDLTILPSYVQSRTVQICADEEIWAGGTYRSESGIYYDTLFTAAGCDSVIITQLEVLPVSSYYQVVVICQGQSYYVGGSERFLPGVYTDTLTSFSGCDSIVITELNVFSGDTTYVSAFICEGDSFFAGGAWQIHAGTYYDTFQVINGCDSIVVTSLQVQHDQIVFNDVTICAGDSFFTENQWRFFSGVYRDSFLSATGCDSIVIVRLSVVSATVDTIDVSLCQGQTYFAQGGYQSQPGEYRDTFAAINGCDSIVVTRLTFLLPVQVYQSVSICEGESYYAGGNWQTTSGVYYDTLTAYNGCDSIITTHLTVLQSSVFQYSVAICAGETYFAAGQYQTEAGTYYDTFISHNGCDSVVLTLLAVLPVQGSFTEIFICEGEQVFVGGAWQTESGYYTDTLSALNGCDSILTTHVTVMPVQQSYRNVSICSGDSIWAQGAYRFASGRYYDTLSSTRGCDSVLITDLTVMPVLSSSLSVSICDGETYYAGGSMQNRSGVYHDTLISSSGCDSVVTTVLTVLPRRFSSRTISICNGDSVFLQGAYRYMAGVYADTLKTFAGCDSIITTTLHIKPTYLNNHYITICQGDSIMVAGQPRKTSGIYTETRIAHNGCDSTEVFYLTVIPVDTSYVTISICQGQTAFIAGALRSAAGTYSERVPSASGCDSVVITSLIVHPLPTVSLGPDKAICAGESAVLSASGADSYLWSTGATSSSIVVSPQVSTSYLVTGYNQHGCLARDTVIVIVNPVPIVSINGLHTAYCGNNADVVLQALPAGATLAGPAIAGNIFSPSSLPPGNYSVQVTYTNAQGCSASRSYPVAVLPVPQVSFSGLDSLYCADDSADSLWGMPAGGVFNGPGINGNYFEPQLVGADTHFISYSYTNNQGCSDTAWKTTVVIANPVVAFGMSDSIFCSGSLPVVLQANPPGGVFSGSGVTDSLFYPNHAGIYPVNYYYENAWGCGAATSINLTVSALPSVSISGLSASYCVQQDAVFLTGIPAGGFFSGPGIDGNIFSPAQAGTGVHQLNYTYRDSFNCEATATSQTQVFGVNSVSIIGLDSMYCEDAQPVVLSAVPAGGKFSGRGVVINIFDAGVAGAGGPFPIVYSLNDGQGCVSADTQWVRVNPLPEISMEKVDYGFCLHDTPLEITAHPPGGKFSGPGIRDNVFYPALAGYGQHSIWYLYTDSNNCSNSVMETFAVELCSGISDLPSEGLHIYPNPFSSEISLKLQVLQEDKFVLTLYDVLGRIIAEEQMHLQPGENQIALKSLSHLPSGTYSLKLSNTFSEKVFRLVKY
ncbi:MAG: hypothetical protein KatS3mg031_1679 [Chitinophagales bacterium]|nr:MAG: hypothetical protein KatS3mg031_1679 [Chitinophagales bacterium]